MNSSSFYKYRHRLGTTLKSGILGVFTEYETPKLVLIHSSTFAYLLIYEKGYQKQDTALISSVTLKVKGIGYIHPSKNQTTVMDVADYIIPPSENSAIFLMTNFIQTDQTRSTCPESASLKEAICDKDNDCQNKPLSPKISGLWTGRCLLSPETYLSNGTIDTTKPRKGLCEYSGWCPPENDQTPMLVQEVLNFTLFIKNFIEFPAFDVKYKNIDDELKPCVFHPKTEVNCPIFGIEYIINEAEKDPDERDAMLRYGGVIRVKLDWDCDLDLKFKQKCKRVYSFARLDVPYREKPFSVGFNFRHSSNWKQNGTNFRTLNKAFGLRLIISVSGKAGKFDIVVLTLNIGSLVGIFGLATFLCDIILLHLSKEARIYRGHVFETVHVGTRLDSVAQTSSKGLIQNDYEYLNSKSTETSARVKKSPGKTVVTRPLTLMNPDDLTFSGSI